MDTNTTNAALQRWIVIDTNGQYTVDQADMSLEGIYAGIGDGCTTFEAVRIETDMFDRDDLRLLIDEEGKLKPLAANPLATLLCYGESQLDIIVGRALLVKVGEDALIAEEDFLALTPEEAQTIFDKLYKEFPKAEKERTDTK